MKTSKLASAILGATSISISAGAAHAKDGIDADRPAIVLVHGAFQTVDAWGPVVNRLRSDGHRVITVNLPGRTGTPLAPSLTSLTLYRDTVIKAISAERRPVVLVGPQALAASRSQTSRSRFRNVSKPSSYVAAFLPRDGASLLDLAKTDAGSLLGPQLKFDADAGLVRVDAASRGAMFANDGTAEQQAWATANAVDEPLIPLATPLHVTPARSGKADRVYIKTMRDQAVSPAFQDSMIAAGNVRLTLSLDTGHLPYLTNPNGLATAIEEAAK